MKICIFRPSLKGDDNTLSNLIVRVELKLQKQWGIALKLREWMNAIATLAWQREY